MNPWLTLPAPASTATAAQQNHTSEPLHSIKTLKPELHEEVRTMEREDCVCAAWNQRKVKHEAGLCLAAVLAKNYQQVQGLSGELE